MILKVVYADIAVGAKDSFAPSSSGVLASSNAALLKSENSIPIYANPCEIYSVLLDESMEIPPDDTEYAFVSSALSGNDGSLSPSPMLTLTASGQYTSQGIALIFDEAANRYASSVNIKWYRDSTLLSDADFTPNSVNYLCENKVENYNKLVITFKKLNMPRNRLYLTGIIYGTMRTFGRDEVEGFDLLQEVNPISEEISINTVNFALKSLKPIDFIFQEKQPIYTYFDDTLVQTTFVKSYERNSDHSYEIESEDWVSILEDSPYSGGMFTAKSASALIGEILDPLNVPYTIESSLSGATVTGYIPICSCRDALNHIAFALGAVVDTSYSADVQIKKLSDEMVSTLDDSNTFVGQTTKFRDKLTELRLTAYSYVANNEILTAYNAEDSGIGNGIEVQFSEPLHDLTISNGTIVASGVNWAKINANTGCVLTGKRYDKTSSIVTRRNPLVLAGDKENVVEITDFTLVDRTKADALAEAAYDYYARRYTISEKIIVGNLKVGDKVCQKYGYMADVVGWITSMKFTVSGTAKVAEVKIT